MTRGIPGSTPGHGTAARYVTGCRCEPCTREKTRTQKKYRLLEVNGIPRMVPRTGTDRRLRALAAIGWPAAELGLRLGLTDAGVRRMYNAPGPVHQSTADRAVRIYNELSMTPGPSSITRARALAKGWAPPLAWDDDTIDDPKATPHRTTRLEREASYRDIDEVAVQRAIDGKAVTLTLPEREAAIRALVTMTDLSDRQIAERFDGCWPETVLRIRKRHGLRGKYAVAS